MAQTSARRIRIGNPDLSKSEKTFLDSDYTSGTDLTVKNNNSFTNNDIVVVGEPGQEKTEGKVVNTTSGSTTITLDSALNFDHTQGKVVYRAEYNRVELSYDRGNGWEILANFDIQWDRKETLYIHQGGVSGYSYRFRFKHTETGNFSEYSPTITGAGFGKDSVGYMVQEVRKAIIDPDGDIVSNSDIIRFLNAAKDIVRGVRNDWWFWKKEDKTTMTTVDGTQQYDLDDISSSIDYIEDVRYNFNDGTRDETWHLKHLPDIEYDYQARDETADEDDELEYYNIKAPDSSSTAGYIRVWPIPATTARGTFYVRYYQPDADLDDIADTTAIPIPQILIDYAIFRCEQIKGDEQKARVYRELFFGAESKELGREHATGISLLLQMQKGKLRPLGQPRAMKRFRGRKAMRAFFKDSAVDRDAIAEDWFDYPRAK